MMCRRLPHLLLAICLASSSIAHAQSQNAPERIDPGIATTGCGVVREERDGRLVSLHHGVILTPKTDSLPKRLAHPEGNPDRPRGAPPRARRGARTLGRQSQAQATGILRAGLQPVREFRSCDAPPRAGGRSPARARAGSDPRTPSTARPPARCSSNEQTLSAWARLSTAVQAV